MRNERRAGFTLLEAVLVLVLAGILYMTAVPKLIDLAPQTQSATARAIVREAQTAINLRFVDGLRKRMDCETAADFAADLGRSFERTEDGFDVRCFLVTPTDEPIRSRSAGGTRVSVRFPDTGIDVEDAGILAVPDCPKATYNAVDLGTTVLTGDSAKR